MTPLHIIYIPGLGDNYDPARRIFLRLWPRKGVTVEHIPIKWADGHPYEEKFSRLEQAIEHAKGKRVVLIGESAGGSMALNMYAKRATSLYKVITICGKNTGPKNVSPATYRKNPAFRTSMEHVETSASQLTRPQRQAFVSIRPLVDHVVPIRQMLIPDCQEKTLWVAGHLFTILCALTVASWYIIRVAKQ